MAQITERSIPLEEAQANFKKLLKCNEKHQLFGSYKVYDFISNEYIGLGHVTMNEEHVKEAEIGYMLLPEHCGKRYGSAIAKELMKVKAKYDPKNVFNFPQCIPPF